MDTILLEPVELADDELDAVAGGLLDFAGNSINSAGSEQELQVVNGAVTNSFNG